MQQQSVKRLNFKGGEDMTDRSKNISASSKVAKVVIYIALILLAITIIVPVAWVFVASIK